MDQEKIEVAFNQMFDFLKSKKNNTEKQTEIIKKIISRGIDQKGSERIWWLPQHLMGNWIIGGVSYFVSYKAQARVSELAKDTERYEFRPCGKYKAIRQINLWTE